jgi:uncharacterized protein YaiL (DUF2058 family)
MAKSIQDQLLAAGAVDKARATKLKKEKHKQGKQRARGSALPDELKLSAEQAQAKKTARDRDLSLQRQAVLEEKAIAAQVVQLVTGNMIERDGGDVAYNFSDQDVVKKIHVTQEQITSLAGGRIAIARLDGGYALIPALVAAKIIERAPAAIVMINTQAETPHEGDDLYADYQIPDDLIW